MEFFIGLVAGVALGHFVPMLYTSVAGWVSGEFKDSGL